MTEKTLSQVVGGVIKSVQRGQETIGGGTLSVNVTITAVDLDKSFLTLTQWTTDLNTDGLASGNLTTSTNLTITKGASGSLAAVFWEVIEYE